MKLLFVAYCFGSQDGQALIGVYKRGLRLAMEMVDRGHRVSFFCTGRDAYQDQLTKAAEEVMEFIDIPFTVAAFDEAHQVRQRFLHSIHQVAPDLVVIGEAPLAGAMLEATLSSAELEIPTLILDNAYNPLFVDHFLRVNGAMADGLVLMGPSSHHLQPAPDYLCQVPPFMTSDADSARSLLAELGLPDERLVTVLAYDRKVERLGLSLAADLCAEGAEIVFCTRDAERCQQRIERLPAAAAGRVRAISQPPEATLLSLLEISRLAVVKYGFMQVAECLTLRTPALVCFHEGPTWIDYLPAESREFTWVTSSAVKDRQTLIAARRFLHLEDGAMDQVHQGELTAVPQVADFLEAFPLTPRQETATQCAALGFTPDALSAAFERLGLPRAPSAVRCLRLRAQPDHEIYAVLCKTPDSTWHRLWGRIYKSSEAYQRDLQLAHTSEAYRRILWRSPEARLLLELDPGEAKLPVLNP